MRFQPRLALYLVCIGSLVTIPTISGQSPTGNFALKGKVEDVAGTPLGGIEVTAATGPTVVSRVVTDPQGRYSLQLSSKDSRPFTILFNGPSFRPSVVQYVSRNSNDNILTTVLLRPGQVSSELSTAVEKAVASYLAQIGGGGL